LVCGWSPPDRRRLLTEPNSSCAGVSVAKLFSECSFLQGKRYRNIPFDRASPHATCMFSFCCLGFSRFLFRSSILTPLKQQALYLLKLQEEGEHLMHKVTQTHHLVDEQAKLRDLHSPLLSPRFVLLSPPSSFDRCDRSCYALVHHNDPRRRHHRLLCHPVLVSSH
jgi:hypothetical protein